ncbi:MAG: aldolase/citrate lyase family protein [Desulfocapsaceae bacterium]
MNRQEKEMVKVLELLKSNHGVTHVKVAMEAEGILLGEILRTKIITMTAGVGLSVKIGGCEAITDTRIAMEHDADILLAPMIESRFALEKFLDMAADQYEKEELEEKTLLINIETMTGSENIADILAAPNVELLDGIVVGRTDLSGALNLTDVNHPDVLEATRNVFIEAKKQSLDCLIGGGISEKTIPFLNDLGDLVDGFETRKVVFYNGVPPGKNLGEAIHQALKFEYLWYLWRQETYGRLSREDAGRIDKMAPRFAQ